MYTSPLTLLLRTALMLLVATACAAQGHPKDVKGASAHPLFTNRMPDYYISNSLYDSTLAYAAAEGALSTYSKGLANEAGPNGVRVNMISPGFIGTAGAMIVALAKSRGTDENAARQAIMDMIGGIPIGRPAQPNPRR